MADIACKSIFPLPIFNAIEKINFSLNYEQCLDLVNKLKDDVT